MNEIVKSETGLAARSATPLAWQMITEVAQAGKGAGLGTTAKTQVQMLMAYEHGFPITSGPQVAHIIDGKPALSPKAVWAKVVGSGELARCTFKRLTDSQNKFVGYQVVLGRTNGLLFDYTFTLEDAARAGLVKKDNYQNWPEQMCMWRALGFLLDVVFPDYTLGMLRAHELGATLDEQGEVWTVQEPNEYEQLLSSLIESVGAERLLAACNNQIPGTVEELAALAQKLAEES
jgi:hypothetical protein